MSLIRTSPAAFSSQMRRLSEKRAWRWRHAYQFDRQETSGAAENITTVTDVIPARIVYRPAQTADTRRPRDPVMPPRPDWRPDLQRGLFQMKEEAAAQR